MSCYGTITLDPDKVISLNFPRAGQITRLLVSMGEMVKKGLPLLEFETSPQDSVGYVQAQSAVDLARHELTRLQSLASEQLATRSQIAQAQKTLIDAEAGFGGPKEFGNGQEKGTIAGPL